MHPYIHLFNRIVPSYGLCMAIGILLSCLICLSSASKKHMDVNSIIIIAACAIGCGLLGAKILYIVVSYDVFDFLHLLMQGDTDKLISSGQVFYGGLIGGIGGAFLGKKISGTQDTPAALCSVIIPVIPFGHGIGRIGCFLAGCCYGAPYSGIFAVSFPAVGVVDSVFPVQILEAILDFIIFGILMFSRKKEKTGYQLLYEYLIFYSTVRFVLEFFRGDKIRGITHGLSTSQWISIGLILFGIVLWSLSARREKRYPYGKHSHTP